MCWSLKGKLASFYVKCAADNGQFKKKLPYVLKGKIFIPKLRHLLVKKRTILAIWLRLYLFLGIRLFLFLQIESLNVQQL